MPRRADTHEFSRATHRFQRAVKGKMRLLGRGVRCVRGGREVFAGLDFEVSAGQALAVVGRNGSGKTSLLRLIARLAVAGRRVGRAGGRRGRDDAGRTGPLSRPSRCTEAGPECSRELSLLAQFSGQRNFRRKRAARATSGWMSRCSRARPRDLPARGLSLGRPATAALDRTPAGGSAPAVAPG